VCKRSGAAAEHRGYFHETAFYEDDEQFVDLVAPFLEGALEAGEPALVHLDEAHTALVGRHVDLSALHVVPSSWTTPARAIGERRRRFDELIADGAGQIRVVGEVPHPGTGGSWDAWSRYEGAVNHAYADFPVWGLCLYDSRVTPSSVVRDARRAHPFEVLPGGERRPSDDFLDPFDYLLGLDAPTPHPLQLRAPDLLVEDPTLVGARAAVAALARGVLGPAGVDDAVIAVSEVVANAWRHGEPPVELRAWAVPGTLVVSVRDHGPGTDDPLVGLLPRKPGSGLLPSAGVGLWMAGQVATELMLHRGEAHDVRLVLEDPSAGAG
jgi:anti-sigma regulatory factor (Ser/Thr protein kinase)